MESLVELSTEFSGHSEATLGNINFEVVEHSSTLSEVSNLILFFFVHKNFIVNSIYVDMQLIREASVKVGDILHDLHSNLGDQEQSLATIWQQQHEVYC